VDQADKANFGTPNKKSLAEMQNLGQTLTDPKRMGTNTSLGSMKGSYGRLENCFKEKLLEVINLLQEDCGSAVHSGITFKQLNRSMMKPKYSSNYNFKEDDVRTFFDDHQIGGLFYYREQLLYMYGGLPKALPIGGAFRKRTKASTDELVRIKKLLYGYISDKGHTLETLFTVIDRDRSGDLSVDELIKGLDGYLSEQEAISLFKAMDVDNSKTITKDELVQELATINAALVLDGIKKFRDRPTT
jgi:hypothetical protein